MWIFLVIISSALLLNYLWTRRDLCGLIWQMPGPSLWFLTKKYYHTFAMDEKGISSMGILKSLQEIRSEVPENLFRFWILRDLYVFVMEPEHLKIILNSSYCLNRGRIYDLAKYFGENGIGLLKMPKWKQSRKMLNPSFNSKACQSYLSIFNQEIKILISLMKDQCRNQEPIDIKYNMAALVADTIFRTMMGKEMSFQKNENYHLLEHMNNLSYVLGQRISNPLLHISLIYQFTHFYRTEKKCSDVIMTIARKVLDEQKAKWLENYNELMSKTGVGGIDEVSTILQIFIDQLFIKHIKENRLSEKEVIGESFTILVAGYETSAVVTVIFIVMLAIFSQHQERIYEEIKSTLLNTEDYVEYEDLNKCEFLDRFIKEVLRLFPPIPLMVRSLEKPIKIGQYSIPPGTQILISLISLHREKNIWGPTADDFDPDRFLPENMKKMHPYAYLPYAAGPRNCIGMKYANVFLKIFLIQMVRNFKFRTDLKFHDLSYDIDFTLKLKNKLNIIVQLRD